MIENVRQAVQNANLYTYLGKIDKIVGTTVEAMGPACKIGDVCTIDVPDVYKRQGHGRRPAESGLTESINKRRF